MAHWSNMAADFRANDGCWSTKAWRLSRQRYDALSRLEFLLPKIVRSVNRQTKPDDLSSVSTTHQGDRDDRCRASGIRHAVCGGVGGTGRQCLSRTVAPG